MDTSNIIVLVYLIFVSLNHTNCKDDVLVKSCPEDKVSWDTAARRKECKPEGGRGYVYHCLKSEGQQLVETCLVAQWIEVGVCPVLFNGGNFGFENCTLIMLRTGGACPKTAYRSNELYKFPICFHINQPKATTTQLNTTIEITTVSATSKPGDRSSNINITTETTTVSVPDCSGRIVGITAGVIVPLLVFGIISIVVYIKHRHDRRRQGYSNGTDVLQQPVLQEEEILLNPVKESTEIPERRIVPLAAFDEGLHILKEHGILIITGQIGSGKTTAMENIIQLLKQEDTEWKVKDISFLTLGRSNSSNDKLIVKWDDCFGKFVTHPVKKKNTMYMFTEICEWVAEGDGNRKCILTMREMEFLSFNLNESDLFRTNDKYANNNVCLDNLSEREKESLVAEMSKEVCLCDECSDIHKTKVSYELMEETESIGLSLLGWPLICRLATIPYIAKNINSFGKDPVGCVMRLFDTLKSTNQQLYCAMIYVLFKGGNTLRTCTAFLNEVIEKLASVHDVEKLMSNGKSESTDDSMKFSGNELNKIFRTHPHYFVNKDKDCFEFHHEIFVLWLLCHFYQRFPETTIKHFELDVLIEILRPNNHTAGKNEIDIEMLCSFDGKDNVPKDHAVVEKHDNPALKQPEEARSENHSWKFTLEEKIFSCFIKRVEKEKEGCQKLQVEKEQKYGMLEGHPLLEDSNFMRIYLQEEALTSVQGSK